MDCIANLFEWFLDFGVDKLLIDICFEKLVVCYLLL